MKKEYGFILIAYIAMQLLGYVGIKVITTIGVAFGMDLASAQTISIPIWLVSSFSITFIISLYLLRNEIKDNYLIRSNDDKIKITQVIFWSIAGVFLALFAQAIAIQIEIAIGIEPGSDNTQSFLNIIEVFPIVMIVTSIIGPILEEIVFRKIIFGTLHKRVNFFIAALLSSLIFAVAHNDLEHTLLYTAMGMVFAFLYVKTKRIIVPILAHVSMNTFVILVQLIFADDIERLQQQYEQFQFIFGGF